MTRRRQRRDAGPTLREGAKKKPAPGWLTRAGFFLKFSSLTGQDNFTIARVADCRQIPSEHKDRPHMFLTPDVTIWKPEIL